MNHHGRTTTLAVRPDPSCSDQGAGLCFIDFGKAENRFFRGNSEEEESPNTEGRDAV